MAISSTVLPDAELEAEAQILAQRIRELTEEEFLQIARLLVGKPNCELFGETELQVRDILHRAGAKAFEEYLRQKKRLPRTQRSLPDLPTSGRVSWLSPQVPREFAARARVQVCTIYLTWLRT